MQEYVLQPTVASGTDITNNPGIFLGDMITYSIQAIFSGVDVVGTFKLQGSNDRTNWVDIANQSTSVTASGGTILGETGSKYKYVRFHWDYTSGTGDITVLAIVKQIVINQF